MYGGNNWDCEHVLCTLQFLDGEAKRWFQHHVVSVKQEKLSWTFEEVIPGLYNRFMHPSTMQDAWEEFLHAQNMAVYPDEYQIMEVFLKSVPTTICDKLFENGLSPEVNTINDLMSCAKAIEMSYKMAEYYRKKALATETNAVGTRTTPHTAATADRSQQRATPTGHHPQSGF